MLRAPLVAILLLVSNAALAQHHQPYAGLERRSVKALSEQQIADLNAGRGMGFALSAELNGYPGPTHVLEHADALSLNAGQRERTKSLIDAMKAEAIPVGHRLIDQETEFERLFSERTITPAALRAKTEEIATTQARLREAHLKYHLAMVELLTPTQIARYRELRGYGSGGPGRPPHHRKH